MEALSSSPADTSSTIAKDSLAARVPKATVSGDCGVDTMSSLRVTNARVIRMNDFRTSKKEALEIHLGAMGMIFSRKTRPWTMNMIRGIGSPEIGTVSLGSYFQSVLLTLNLEVLRRSV